MHRVVITGGPGAGKTSLIAELGRRGFATIGESARAVIAERVARGLPPRPDPESFAREILRRDLEKYSVPREAAGIVFYDRCAVEALGMVSAAAPLREQDLRAQLEALKFHELVFVLPPWKAIYRMDAERDHSFEHAERVHGEIVRWYVRCGYRIDEVPRLSVEQRAVHVLRSLGIGGA
jgi:predicted ATPase